VTQAYWFEHRETGGFPVQRAAIGECDLSVLRVGEEDYHWLVRREGRDVAEGVARSAAEAQRQAEVAVREALGGEQ
jgi:hypothetical protein